MVGFLFLLYSAHLFAVTRSFEDLLSDEKKVGVRTECYSFFLKHPTQTKTAVLLIHGYTSSPPEVRLLGQYLFEHDLDVLGIRLAGHGTKPEDLKNTTWMDWYQSAQEGYLLLKEQGYEKIYVYGVCLGALLALNLASEYPVDGLVLAGTPFRVHYDVLYMGSLVYPSLKFFNMDLGYIDVPIPPERQHITYLRNPIDSSYQFLEILNHTKRILPKITAPTLIMHCPTDNVAHPDSATYLYQHIPATQKNIIWTGHEHSFLIDYDERNFRVISNFFHQPNSVILEEMPFKEDDPSFTAIPYWFFGTGFAFVGFGKKAQVISDYSAHIYTWMMPSGGEYRLSLKNSQFDFSYYLDTRVNNFFGFENDSGFIDLATYRNIYSQFKVSYQNYMIPDYLSYQTSILFNQSDYSVISNLKQLDFSKSIENNPQKLLGVSASLKWNTLNDPSNSSYGSLYQGSLTYYPPSLMNGLNDHAFTKMGLDIRIFREVAYQYVLAYRIQGEAIFGNASVYFYPYLGGYYQCPAFTNKRYTGKYSLSQELEFRFPIIQDMFNIFSVTGLLFINQGCVGNRIDQIFLADFHTGFGGGVRFFNPGLMVGFDLGKYLDEWVYALNFGNTF